MPLQVAVLVTLFRHEAAGGHVKSWERFADAAAAFPERVDLTAYFLGAPERDRALADTVRLAHLPPRLGTDRLRFLRTGAGDTDLAHRHPLLAQQLAGADLLHVTDTFAFGRTARAAAKARGLPLTFSIQTDLPHFTEIYAREVIAKAAPAPLARFLIDRLGAPRRAARANARAVSAMADAADHVMASNAVARADLARQHGEASVSLLRRGLDFDRFNPARRDRAWLAGRFGIPEGAVVLLFAGRADASKRVMTAAHAAEALIAEGHDVRFFLAGEGAERPAVQALLGSRAIAPGTLVQEDLARIYAASDLFIFPSESETRGMVVLEAKAAGLPVAVREGEPTAEAVGEPGGDGIVVPESDPQAWAAACRPLIVDADGRRAMGRAARAWTQANVLNWRDVFAQDLLAIWERVAESHDIKAR